MANTALTDEPKDLPMSNAPVITAEGMASIFENMASSFDNCLDVTLTESLDDARALSRPGGKGIEGHLDDLSHHPRGQPCR